MLINYLKIGFRNLWKHKLFSFINIFGLAVGMVVSILVLINIKSAFEYDKFHPHPDRTYRIITDAKGKGGEQSWASTTTEIAGTIRKYSFIEESVQVFPGWIEFLAGNESLETDINYVDSGFFRVFGFKILRGSFDESPYTIVLSEQAARRYFGKKDPLGKTLKQKNGPEFTITGILAEPEGKSHLGNAAFSSLATLRLIKKEVFANPFDHFAGFTYVLLKEGNSPEVLDQTLSKISREVTKSIPAGNGLEKIAFRAQPLNKINPAREDLRRTTSGGREISMIEILVQVAIGLLTLLLAGFNYVNLTLARSLSRAREVGVRKVIGAQKWQLFLQFIIEASILSACALVLSLAMLQLIKPIQQVSNILDNAHWDISMWLMLLTFSLMTGLLAGIIPAKILSSYKAINALKKMDTPVIFRGLTLRKSLIVVQFAISLTGIIFMLIMYRQQKFMAEAEYGFNRENILNIETAGHDYKVLAAEVLKQPGVEQVTATSGSLGAGHSSPFDVQTVDKKFSAPVTIHSADKNFIEVMGLKLIAGENLPYSVSDSSGNIVLANEKAISELHYGNARDAVGQLIWLDDSTQARIAGVVKDFHFLALSQTISPFMIRYEPKHFQMLQLKVSVSALPEKIKTDISNRLAKLIIPAEQDMIWFDRQLYDSQFHGNDQLFFGILTGMILSIACLGLLGMVTYTSEIRRQEVGIRKIIGASVGQVVLLLSRDFIWLLGIASLIALPAGLIAGTFFLNYFAYRVTIGAVTILSAFFALFLIGGLTIGIQTYRTAISNPVKSLRTE